MEQIVSLMASKDRSLRVALRQSLRSLPELSPIREVDDCPHLLSQMRGTQPALLLLDVDLQPADDEPMLPQLHRLSPATRTLLFCERLSWQLVTEAVEQGAQGCVLRDAPADD